MSHWKSLAVVCASWIVLVSGYPEFAEAQQAVDTSVTVGGRAIVFPAPHGFVRSDGISAEWDSAVTAMLPVGGWEVGLLSNDKTPAAFTGNTIFLPARSVVALVRAQIPRDEPVEIPRVASLADSGVFQCPAHLIPRQPLPVEETLQNLIECM